MNVAELPRGLHPGVPHADYHARIPGMASMHALNLVRRAPAVYRAWLDGAQEDEDTSTFAFGRAFHCALLEPERFELEYAVVPDFGDFRFKENKARRDAWREENRGVTELEPKDARALHGMVASVRRHPLAARMVEGGFAELTARWTDEATGLECKARADYYVMSKKLVVDVKTTTDARTASFRKSVANFLYHRQDAFYRDGFAAAGAEVEHFVFLCVEKDPPYLVALFALDELAVGRGRETVREDLATLAQCIEEDRWPGHPETIQVLDLPPWAA